MSKRKKTKYTGPTSDSADSMFTKLQYYMPGQSKYTTETI